MHRNGPLGLDSIPGICSWLTRFYCAGHSLDLAGPLLGQLFRQLFRKLCKDVQRFAQKCIDKGEVRFRSGLIWQLSSQHKHPSRTCGERTHART